MATYVKNYVSQCDWCAHFKESNTAPPRKLQSLDTPNMPWVDISTDFITDLPLSNGYDSILVVVDHFSNEVEFIPCNKTVTALETAKLYLLKITGSLALLSPIVDPSLHCKWWKTFANASELPPNSSPLIIHKLMVRQNRWTVISNNISASLQQKSKMSGQIGLPSHNSPTSHRWG